MVEILQCKFVNSNKQNILQSFDVLKNHDMYFLEMCPIFNGSLPSQFDNKTAGCSLQLNEASWQYDVSFNISWVKIRNKWYWNQNLLPVVAKMGNKTEPISWTYKDRRKKWTPLTSLSHHTTYFWFVMIAECSEI